MTRKSCTCPSFEGKTFSELITSLGLLERKGKSKNCCEQAGYICPELDKALRKAYNKQYADRKKKQKAEEIESTVSTTPTTKIKSLRKTRLTY